MNCNLRLMLVCFLSFVAITTSNTLRDLSSVEKKDTYKDVRSVKRGITSKSTPKQVETRSQPEYTSEDMAYSVDDSVDEGPVLSCEEIFMMTDSNGDNAVTEAEYRMKNPNMTDEEVGYVFRRYDSDGDGVILLEDLCMPVGIPGELPAPTEVDCRTLAMQICDEESFLVVLDQMDTESADVTVCMALQVHIDCVIRENAMCELDDYLDDVTQTVATFIRAGICPNIQENIDTESVIPATGVRQVRSTRSGHRSGRLSNSLRNTNVEPSALLRSSHLCLRSTMQPCNTNFISSLRSGAIDPCETLVAFRRCARKSTRRCHDTNNAMRIRDGIKSITRAHRRAKLCL